MCQSYSELDFETPAQGYQGIDWTLKLCIIFHYLFIYFNVYIFLLDSRV